MEFWNGRCSPKLVWVAQLVLWSLYDKFHEWIPLPASSLAICACVNSASASSMNKHFVPKATVCFSCSASNIMVLSFQMKAILYSSHYLFLLWSVFLSMEPDFILQPRCILVILKKMEAILQTLFVSSWQFCYWEDLNFTFIFIFIHFERNSCLSYLSHPDCSLSKWLLYRAGTLRGLSLSENAIPSATSGNMAAKGKVVRIHVKSSFHFNSPV